jgi:hypothetical protein
MLNKIFQVRVGTIWSQNNSSIEWNIAKYWDSDAYYFINQSDSEEIQDVFKLVLQSQNTVNKGNIVYASKASEIPRFKLKEFIKDKRLKKTSRYNHADVVIINKGYMMELLKKFKFDKYTFIKGDFVKTNIKKWANPNLKDKGKSILDIVNNTKDINLVAMIDNYSINDIPKSLVKYPAEFAKYKDNTYQIKGTFISLYRNERLKNLLGILYELKDVIKSGRVKIVFDEDLFVELNKEGIELDEEYLQTLHDMLFSKDTANIKLGFEMMSNLVLNQSTILSISFLLNKLMSTTKFRPSYYTSSNTNLKSLFKLLRTKGIYWERDWKTFGTGLRNNFKIGKEGDIVKKFLLDNINREFKLSNTAAESLVDIVFSTETQVLN